MEKKLHYHILIFSLFLFSYLLFLWGMVRNDVGSDFALNATRAVEWFDFLVGEGQTSPVQWFEEMPWWVNLSFHDHPPLALLTMHISFRIFGENAFAARLPFILSGIGVLSMAFFLMRRIYDERTAIFSVITFAVSSYFLWMVRAAFNEGIAILFVFGSFFFLTLFFHSRQKKFLYAWGLCVGLSLVTKYTSVFIIPAAFLCFFLWERKTFLSKDFYFSLFITFLVISPVLLYNIMMYKTRGHLDAALSIIFKKVPEDYSVFIKETNSTLVEKFQTFSDGLFNSMSIPFFLLLLCGVIYILFTVFWKKQSNALSRCLSAYLIMGLSLFLFGGGAHRNFSIIIPFLLFAAIIFLVDMWKRYRQKNYWKYVSALIIIIFSWEFFYSLNTNIFEQPAVSSQLFYSKFRFYNYNFYELEKYFQDAVLQKNLVKSPRDAYLNNLKEFQTKDQDIILVDERIDWFSRMWYIQRYQTYYATQFILFSDIARAIEEAGVEVDFFDFLPNTKAKTYWAVIAGDAWHPTEEIEASYGQFMNDFETILHEKGIDPVHVIYSPQNKVSFRIYHFQLTPDAN